MATGSQVTTATREQPRDRIDAGTPEPQQRRHEDHDYTQLAYLFDELNDRSHSPEHRSLARDRVVAGHMSVAQHIARKFSRRGQPIEDLTQVAMLGLINAVDRFDPSRGKDFLSFAVPTITGEVRRYFRDHGWAMRVPRRLQELRAHVSRATTELGQVLGRAPTASEVAEHIDISVAEVREAYEVSEASRVSTLEHVVGGDDNDAAGAAGATLGSEDARLSTADERAYLAPAMARLPERERTIVWLRFFENQSQSNIAQRMNISQMHVSRLLGASLRTMREVLSER